ncbi:histidine kinase [Elizabethkingia anophelis]
MNHEGIVLSGNTLVLLLILLLLGVTGYLIYKISVLQKEKKALTEEKKVLKNRLGNIRLDYIETKLNPHLFKNILNSVQSHAYQTYVSLDKLSGVLDYILYESSEKFVTPESELDFTSNLIEINKIKVNPLFDFRIKSQVDKQDPVYKEKVLRR